MTTSGPANGNGKTPASRGDMASWAGVVLALVFGIVVMALIACAVSYHEHRSLDITIGESNKMQDETKVIGNHP